MAKNSPWKLQAFSPYHVPLPAQDPDELKKVDEYLKSEENACSEFTKFVIELAKGSTNTQKANAVMEALMTYYCGAHYVWDGIHKSRSEGKLALKASLPTLTRCLKEAFHRATPADNQFKALKGAAGRWLTLAPNRIPPAEPGAKQKPIKKPWVYGQVEETGNPNGGDTGTQNHTNDVGE